MSWHADSCLEHYSTIAVYHATDPETSPADWKIALRVEPDAEGPTAGRLKLAGRKEVWVERVRAGRQAGRQAGREARDGQLGLAVLFSTAVWIWVYVSVPFAVAACSRCLST